MMSLIRRITPDCLAGLLVMSLAVGAVSTLAGCEKEPEKQTKKAPPPPPPPPPPISSVDDLMSQMQIDPAVRMAEENAPATTDERRGVLTFFDAWVRGDHQTVANMLGAADRMEIQTMVQDGQWAEATSDIDAVDIRVGRSNRGENCVLAIYEVGFGFQPQLWRFSGSGDMMVFEAVATPPNMVDRLTGDHIVSWWEILNEEEAL